MEFDEKAQEAAESLRETLLGNPDIRSIGLGAQNDRPAIFVYAARGAKLGLEKIGDSWHGFPIVVKRVSRIVPLGRS